MTKTVTEKRTSAAVPGVRPSSDRKKSGHFVLVRRTEHSELDLIRTEFGHAGIVYREEDHYSEGRKYVNVGVISEDEDRARGILKASFAPTDRVSLLPSRYDIWEMAIWIIPILFAIAGVVAIIAHAMTQD